MRDKGEVEIRNPKVINKYCLTFLYVKKLMVADRTKLNGRG